VKGEKSGDDDLNKKMRNFFLFFFNWKS